MTNLGWLLTKCLTLPILAGWVMWRVVRKACLLHRWQLVKQTSVWAHCECAKCGKREAFKTRGGYGYINDRWLNGGEW